MPKSNVFLNSIHNKSNWVTIREGVEMINQLTNIKITNGDIYRHALYGNICLSIYFQSSVMLRKVSNKKNKVKLQLAERTFISRLCLLNNNYFLNDINLIVSTEGKYTSPPHRIIDTNLIGLEYVVAQRLLANFLGIPPPVKGPNNVIPGISVNFLGETYLLYEKISWRERIYQQIMKLPQDVVPEFHSYVQSLDMNQYYHKEYFPVHNLPQDACFVIRYTELEKLINMPIKNKALPASSTRISTPLSRLFWLACKYNETISPLINQPYKLLSIFEQWASAEGITDRLSGDTLKTALERGSPTSVSASN